MKKFTLGPWKADGYNVRQSGKLGTRMIADVCYTGPHHTPPNEYPKSCKIVDEANARLIAASPDLLDACKEALALIQWHWPLEHGNPTIGKAWGLLEDAIAKAERGEA